MGRFSKTLVLGSLILTGVLVAAACSPDATGGEKAVASSVSPANGAVQSSDGGKVTIDVEWLGIDGDRLSFAVAMNTHSVNLDGYDLGELAVLRDDNGKEYRAESWNSDLGDHHRRGTLAFVAPDSVRSGGAVELEMVIRDVAGVAERVLAWRFD